MTQITEDASSQTSPKLKIHSLESAYLLALDKVLQFGHERSDRTGTGTFGLFGLKIRGPIDDNGFPAFNTKRLAFRSMATELVWFMQGRNDVKWLQDRGCTIWDEWVKADGTIGPGYGVQWRSWNCGLGLDESGATNGLRTTTDQLAKVIADLRRDPYSRRHIVSAWNVGDLSGMALPPCHLLYQFHVQGNKLSCMVHQRSADMLLGVPFNIASYSLLTHIVAKMVGLEVGELVMNFGDAHIYKNHVTQVREQLSRGFTASPPTLVLPEITDLESLDPLKFQLVGYYPQAAISAPVAV